MLASFVLYIRTGGLIKAAVSTEDREFAQKLKQWAESKGYEVKFSAGDELNGPEHQ